MMYANRESLDTDAFDDFVLTCTASDCPALGPYGPWNYHIARTQQSIPGHAEARHVDAEKAWEAHVGEHHPNHKAQHRARPEEPT